MGKDLNIYVTLIYDLIKNPEKQVTLLGYKNFMKTQEGQISDWVFHCTDVSPRHLRGLSSLVIPFVPIDRQKSDGFLHLDNISNLVIPSLPEKDAKAKLSVLEFYKENPEYRLFAAIPDLSTYKDVKSVEDVKENMLRIYRVNKIGEAGFLVREKEYFGLNDKELALSCPKIYSQVLNLKKELYIKTEAIKEKSSTSVI